MKRYLLLILLAAAVVPMWAIDNYIPANTDMANGRYEYIESNIARKLSVLVDKYEGRVWMVFENELGIHTFNEIFVENRPVTKTDRINYQLYMGGLAVRDCYLVHIYSGQVWNLVKATNEQFLFESVSRNDGVTDPRLKLNGRIRLSDYDYDMIFEPVDSMYSDVNDLCIRYSRLFSLYEKKNISNGLECKALKAAYHHLYIRPTETNIEKLQTILEYLEGNGIGYMMYSESLRKAQTDEDRVNCFLSFAKKE